MNRWPKKKAKRQHSSIGHRQSPDTSVPASLSVIAWGENDFGQCDVPPDLTNVVMLAGGLDHSLALREDGSVVAWGGASSRVTNVPPGLGGVVAIAAGDWHSLALLSNGTVTAWGSNYWGQVSDVPPGLTNGLTNVIGIAAGGNHSLALTEDGLVLGWGRPTYDQIKAPAGLSNVLAVAAGANHSLALRDDGAVVAWGLDDSRQTQVPPGLSHVTAIAAAADHNLALRDDGTVVAWGDNTFGQTNVPADLRSVAAIAAGAEHSLALQSNGTLVAWGGNSRGQTLLPPAGAQIWQIAAGGYHNLAYGSGVSPFIIEHPTDTAVYLGDTATFHVQAAGSAPLNYQWRREGMELSGAVHGSLILSNVQPGQVDAYDVVVFNLLGSVTSHVASLTVTVGFPTILVQPSGQVAFPGGTATFAVAVEGVEPMTFQWYHEGVVVPNATNTTLVLEQLTSAQLGNYWVGVSNAYGSTNSAYAVLSVVPVAAWDQNGFGQLDVPPTLNDVVAVALGEQHSVALTRQGVAVAWGGNGYGQTDVPSSAQSNVAAIAAGHYHTVALRNDGLVVAWGLSDEGQTEVPPDLADAVAIAAGDYHSLAVRRDGTVVAWGYDGAGQTDVPPALTNVVAVAGGGSHSLALQGDGKMIAWGDNTYGQAAIPEGLGAVVAIAAGWAHNVVLRQDGTVMAWGCCFSQTNLPSGLTNIVAIASGGTRNLALRQDGTVIGWGELGSVTSYVPAGLTNVVATAVSDFRSLALVGEGPPFVTDPPLDRTVFSSSDVLIRAWAVGELPLSYQWQFGDSDIPGATSPVLILTNVQPSDAGQYRLVVTNARGTAMSAPAALEVLQSPPFIPLPPVDQVTYPRGSAVFGVAADGSLPLSYQWRLNGEDITGATNAVLLLDHVTVDQAGAYSVRVSNSIGVATSSVANLTLVPVAAWGRNLYGQASLVPSLTNAVAISAGLGSHNLALRADGRVVVWGMGSSGQTNLPLDLTNVVAVAAGGFHSLALRADGTVAAWGTNTYGQVDVPTGLSNVTAVAAGSYHSLALQQDGAVVAWGHNAYGQASVPTGLTNVVAIAAGWLHSLALKEDGTVVAWGGNFHGQASVPTGLTNVVAIACGWYHSLALRYDGTVVAWGSTEATNVPPGLGPVVAIAAGGCHSLALQQDGTMVSWGCNQYGQTNVPLGLSNLAAVVGGASHSLALLGDGSPQITLAPGDRTVVASNSIVLRALAAGPGPLWFQWQLDGTNIAHATNSFFEITPAQGGDAGLYSVTVSNATGAVTSRVATLTVLTPPALDRVPVDVTAQQGTKVTFEVQASGTAPLQYQWRKNGVNIFGETNDTLVIPSVQVSDGGSCSVVVANRVGAVTSDPVILLVVVPSLGPAGDDFAHPTVITGTNDLLWATNLLATREPGEPYHAGKFGSNSVWYRWEAPTNGIATFRTIGSTFDTLLGIYTGADVSSLVPVASDEDRGGYLTSQLRFNALAGTNYAIAVDGFVGGAGDFILAWELEAGLELPIITNTPLSQTVTQGQDVVLSVGATGTNLTYQWHANGIRWEGATNAQLFLENIQPGQVGSYVVAVTNQQGRGVESLPAVIEMSLLSRPQATEDKPEDLFPELKTNGVLLLSGAKGFTTAALSIQPTAPWISVSIGTIDAQTFNSTGATTQPGETNHCGVIGGSSRWLRFKAVEDGTVQIDTIGSDYDTVLAVYLITNKYLARREVACDDNSAPDGLRSWVWFEALAGSNYLVAVDGVGGVQGFTYLNWRFGLPPDVSPQSDSHRTLQPGETLMLSVTNKSATPPVVCRWWRDDQFLEGATEVYNGKQAHRFNLVLTNVTFNDAGFYVAVISNLVQSVVMPVANVVVEPPLVTVAASEFESGPEGWTWAGSASNLIHHATNGNPGGYIAPWNLWLAQSWYWEAPTNFLRDRSATYGGWLTFDLRLSDPTNAWSAEPDLIISGHQHRLFFYRLIVPGTTWKSYDVSLHETAGWLREDGLVPTQEEMRAVLSDLQELKIRGSFGALSAVGDLDNVTLLAPFFKEAPVLNISLGNEGQTIVLEWADDSSGFVPESAEVLSLPSSGWTTNIPWSNWIVSNGVSRGEIQLSPSQHQRFFRLRKQ
jgi:alpha-tubulin suppressor-like RCC1 family protein